jgi:hypothetical protein
MLAFEARPYQVDLIEAIEQRNIRKAITVWPRRCLSGNTHILLENGSHKLLKDIQAGDKILSWNGNQFVVDIVKDVWKTETKQTKHIKSNGYLPIIASDDHQFAYMRYDSDIVYWRKVSELTEYNYLLNYAGIPLGKEHSPDLAEFLGYMICDGYVSGYQQPKFTNTNKEILDRVAFLSHKLFGYILLWRPKGNGYDLEFINGTKDGGYILNKIKDLFGKDGLDKPKSKRRLNPIIWDFDEISLLRFFAAVISSDGNIYSQKQGFETIDPKRGLRKIPPATEITISVGQSYDMAWDYYWLLRKMGIVPHVLFNEKSSNWKIRISKNSAIKRLLNGGPIYGKQEAQQSAYSKIEASKRSTKIVKGCFRSKVDIKDNPDEELYDLETTTYGNFVANGYLVHNSGKDICAFNIMINQAINHKGVYFYIFPTYAQGKKCIWDSITIEGHRFLDYVPKSWIESLNSQEMKIRLKNSSIIQICGSENIDSLVGTNPRGIIYSEYSLQNPACYQFFRPVLLANGGWSIFCSTPRGKNHLYDLFKIAERTPSWYTSKLTLDDTQHIDPQMIQEEIDNGEMSWEMAQQEYWTSWDLGVTGSVYMSYIDKMNLNGQIGQINWEPAHKVHTSWDIGVADMTSIIFWQHISGSVRIIDCYEKNREGLEHYVNILQSKPYTYGKHIAPHDIAVQEFGSGITRIEKARQLGLKFTTADDFSLQDGIEACRSTLPKVWIDEKKCARLIKCLENYRYEYDQKRQNYKSTPLHDWSSHFADSFRYLCVSLPKTKDGLSSKELDQRFNEARYGQTSTFASVFQKPTY